MMRSSERTGILVSRASMLSICTSTECTTIVFGQGTCVEHDGRHATADNALTEEATRPEQPREGVQALSPIGY